MKRLFATGVLLLLQSCGTVEVPDTTYYRLRLPPAAGGATLQGESIGIGAIRLSADLATDRLMVSEGPVRMHYYHYHQWAGSLDRLIGDALWLGLSRSGCFSDVVADAYSSDVDYVLDVHVHAFHLSVEDDGWHGHAAIEYRVSTPDGKTVMRREIESREPVAQHDPEGVVLALSIATDSLVDQLLGECERHGLFEREPVATPAR